MGARVRLLLPLFSEPRIHVHRFSEPLHLLDRQRREKRDDVLLCEEAVWRSA